MRAKPDKEKVLSIMENTGLQRKFLYVTKITGQHRLNVLYLKTRFITDRFASIRTPFSLAMQPFNSVPGS
ncbi:hypothetical protein BH23BAC3_BH23BAC3_07160 [soil metagenome]